MLHNYFVVAIRNLLQNKFHSAINILSLSIGMGICLTICQYIFLEMDYDSFHQNSDNTYRIVVDEIKPDGELYPYPYETGYAVGVAAKEQIPEITQYVRVHKYSGGAVVSNSDKSKIFTEDALNMLFVDETFLHLFDFPLVNGRKESAFNNKFSIVVTTKIALKYFNTTDAIGKVLLVDGGVSPGSYTITGILEDLPVNTHLQFDYLIPVENYMELGWGGAATKNDDGWMSPDFATYVTLDRSVDVNSVTKKLDELIKSRMKQKEADKNTSFNARLQPIRAIHLRSDNGVDQSLVKNNGNIREVRFFAVLAAFILIVAFVNYINLATARSMHRAKEVGIRKSIGAFRIQLIAQFLMESFVINFLSAAISIGIASLVLPILANIIDKQVELTLLKTTFFWLWFFVVVLIGSILSGVFPAFVLSSFKPISMLGTNKVSKVAGVDLRKALITFQFLISLFLIAGTYLVHKQIRFMKEQEMGMEMEKMLVVRGPEANLDRLNLESTLQSFTKKVSDHHAIASVAASSSVPGKGYNTGIAVRKLGEPESANKFGRVVFAGLDLPIAYGMDFLAGQSPTQEMLNGSEVVVVINAEAVHAFGLGSPEKALNEQLFYKNDTFKIVGVVQNFHWHSLADAHTPYLFEFYNDCRSFFSFRLNMSDIRQSLAHIESTYETFFPGNAFNYFFLEDEFNKQYHSDILFGNLFLSFTILAMFVACIGLFALVSYSAIKKIKEIGIRKVLGATISNLMAMLSKEYFILLAIANIIAIPAIWYWGNNWLSNYAFRTALTFEIFLIPGVVVTLISLVTVSFRTYLAASADPVKSLKVE